MEGLGATTRQGSNGEYEAAAEDSKREPPYPAVAARRLTRTEPNYLSLTPAWHLEPDKEQQAGTAKAKSQSKPLRERHA